MAAFTLPSKIKVRIVEAPFEEAKLVFDEHKPCLVGGKMPFGTDCNRPSTYVKELTITVEGVLYRLDTSAMFDAWRGRPPVIPPKKGVKGIRYFGGRCLDAQNCIVRGLFSDGAGTFVAEWRVFEGVPVRTVLTTSQDVIAAFMNDIDGGDW